MIEGNVMTRKYESPVMNVLLFSNDVITNSGGSGCTVDPDTGLPSLGGECVSDIMPAQPGLTL
ncbi:hypothetical protein BHAP_0817 [Bifidobacterium hapali]|uniref:Uncharacterized protein n=2 Tax=Bifidobacterium hapali TaxID=1630172 RepID=A0A261G0C8_9BIFI|nr:hypothetical protein BHAP_0817 [Bifidobacterium hapali]